MKIFYDALKYGLRQILSVIRTAKTGPTNQRVDQLVSGIVQRIIVV
jgi:hypothetical protein